MSLRSGGTESPKDIPQEPAVAGLDSSKARTGVYLSLCNTVSQTFGS